MKALISPKEPREAGYRVAAVRSDDKVFGVAAPLFWVDCDDDTVADRFWYDPETKTIQPTPGSDEQE